MQSIKNLIINRKEVFRYLGYKSGEINSQTSNLVENITSEVEASLNLKACYKRFPVFEKDNGCLDLGFAAVKSENLKKNLKNCHEIILFAATIGFDTDRIIQKYSRISPSRAVVAQAAGTAAIEEWCNILCREFEKESNMNNEYLRPRFSPGYGDFSIEYQKDIISVLDAERKAGITLTDHLLMMPSKSVSAVAGISKTKTNCISSGCEMCNNTECPYRRS